MWAGEGGSIIAMPYWHYNLACGTEIAANTHVLPGRMTAVAGVGTGLVPKSKRIYAVCYMVVTRNRKTGGTTYYMHIGRTPSLSDSVSELLKLYTYLSFIYVDSSCYDSSARYAIGGNWVEVRKAVMVCTK